MPDGWLDTTLGAIAHVNPEAVANLAADHEIRYVDIGSVTAERGIDERAVSLHRYSEAPGRARRRIRSDDVIVSTVRPNLRAVAQVPFELDGEVASTGFAVLRAKSNVLPGYLFVSVRSEAFVDEMVSRCSGSNYPAIRAEDVSAFRLQVPPMVVQRRIVDLVGHLDRHIANLRSERDSLLDLANETTVAHLAGALGDSRLDVVELASVWIPASTAVRVQPSETYRIAGVLNQGKGVVDKGSVQGSETQYSRLFELSAGQVVMRRLTAWEGPITVVPDAFEGFYVSNEFPTFEIDTTQMTVPYAEMLCRWPGLWDRMRQRVTGSVMRRKRLSPEQLLSVQVPVCSLTRQAEVANAVASLRSAAERMNHEVTALSSLRSVIIDGVAAGAIDIPGSYDSLIAEVA